VDSGFIVHETRTCPNLLRLFGELGVATQDSEMSMTVRCEGLRAGVQRRAGRVGCSLAARAPGRTLRAGDGKRG
jgi:predicted NAD/FAD-binding protein